MFDEWCGGSGGRLIPLPIVQLWDAKLAADEVERNAARGGHAVCFTEIPPFLGLPSVHDADGYWDPFFQRVRRDRHRRVHAHRLVVEDAVHLGRRAAGVGSTLTYMNAAMSMTDFLMSGIFEKFPKLVVAYSEGQIGWIPYILERADTVWHENRGWGGVADKVKRPPSEYYHDHVYGCFFDDLHGLASLDVIGVDNVTFETDYPAQRHDVAPHEEGRRGDHEGPHRRAGRQDLPHQRDPHAPPRSAGVTLGAPGATRRPSAAR